MSARLRRATIQARRTVHPCERARRAVSSTARFRTPPAAIGSHTEFTWRASTASHDHAQGVRDGHELDVAAFSEVVAVDLEVDGLVARDADRGYVVATQHRGQPGGPVAAQDLPDEPQDGRQ